MARLHTIKPAIGQVPSRLAVVNPDSWRSGRTTAERGYGAKWQRYRAAYLVKHPLCVMCEQQGRVTAATVVDHIIPHRGDTALFWREANHMALCAHCHNSDKQRDEARGRV